MRNYKVLLIFICSLIMISGCNNQAESKELNEESKTQIAAQSEIEKSSETEYFDLDKYKSKISKFNTDVYDASILLSNAAKYEKSYWQNLEKLNGNVDSEKIYQKAVDWLIENASEEYNVTASTLTDNYKTICSGYSEIVELSIESSEVSAINDAYKQLFDNYCNLYMMVTSPSGSIDSFVDNYNNYIDNIKKYNTMLETFLE